MSDNNNNNNKSILRSIIDSFKNTIRRDIRSLEEETINDVIGNNAKIVIFTLFGLLFVSIIMYTILITGKYNPESVFSQTIIPEGFEFKSPEDVKRFGLKSLEQQIYEKIINDTSTNATVKLQQIRDFDEQRITYFQDRFQQIEQIDAVFIAAITGAVALGGTLITQLWGRRRQ